ncbi:hypothetical protein AAMO2058_000461500 [Amorphochlora amoebiformis]
MTDEIGSQASFDGYERERKTGTIGLSDRAFQNIQNNKSNASKGSDIKPSFPPRGTAVTLTLKMRHELKYITEKKLREEFGISLRSRYSEMLLNNALTATLLANAAYKIFQTQAKTPEPGSAEAFFVLFSVWSFLSELLAVIFSLFMWDLLLRPLRQTVPLFLHFHRFVLWAPRGLTLIGLLSYAFALVIQSSLHYGEFCYAVFFICYSFGLVGYFAFFVWIELGWAKFKKKGREVQARISRAPTTTTTMSSSHMEFEFEDYDPNGTLVKRKMCKKMLVHADLAALLIEMGYRGYQSQLEVIYVKPGEETTEGQRAFLFLSVLGIVSFGLALFVCFFLWGKCNKVDDSVAPVLLKTFRRQFDIPAYMMGFGIIVFLSGFALQGELDYGDYAEELFGSIYVIGGLVGGYIIFIETKARKETESDILIAEQLRGEQDKQRSKATVNVQNFARRGIHA